MMPPDILQIWIDLANEKQEGSTLIRRRVEPDSPVDIFFTHSVSDCHPGMLIEAVGNANRGDKWPLCHGLRIICEVKPLERQFRSSIWIVLEDGALRDIFAVLCADLVGSMISEGDADRALTNGLRRLARWHVLFDRLTSNGLSREKQQGLFGELSFILKLMNISSPENAVNAWHGWDSAHQDFKIGGLGLEVKTSSSKRHAKIVIANEKQLDESPWTRLLLAFIRVDLNVSGGLTLPATVAAVRQNLDDYPVARSDFDLRLLETGYVDNQAYLYLQDTFAVNDIRYFEVRDHFPRLTDSNLPVGVGDISYSILASELGEFEITDAHVDELIRETVID